MSSSRVKSMTGFGQGAAEDDGIRAEVELRGINHRYLDLKLKLPAPLGGYEPHLRARMQRALRRGRIDVTFSRTAAGPRPCRVQVNRELVARYIEAAAALKREFRLRGTVGIEAVLALPGALTVQEEPRAEEGLDLRVLERALDAALAAYDAMRSAEGERLAGVLREHLAAIAGQIERIEQEGRDLPVRYADRLRERVAALLRDHRGLDEDRVAQEVALLADRADITEEIVRLRAYVEQARGTLERPPGPVGKALDFVMQEMNREANTISSKAESLPIRRAALAIRSEVEKIREQVQNLE